MKRTKTSLSIFALALALATPSFFSQQASRPTDVLGLAVVGHHSEGGIIDYNKGKAALVRDPDAGTYIMLWQPAR